MPQTAQPAARRDRLHILFEAGMFIKGCDSLVEITLGFIFAFVSSVTVNRIIMSLFGDELTEVPRDAIVNFFLHGASGISASTQAFWAFVFLAHGITKLFLVIGLYKKKVWVYPVAAAAFAIFVIYQTYHLLYYPSILLSILTVLDIGFIYLILREYRYQLRRGK